MGIGVFWNVVNADVGRAEEDGLGVMDVYVGIRIGVGVLVAGYGYEVV